MSDRPGTSPESPPAEGGETMPVAADDANPETAGEAKQPDGPRQERIAKVIARAGVASRRQAEALIEEGRVKVNGERLLTPAFTVSPDDAITVDGAPLPTKLRTRAFLFHKPRGLVTTNHDPDGRPTIFEALPGSLPRVVTVGRLDINTEGLLILTNDGGLARVLELPATGWTRKYRVRVHGEVDEAALARLSEGTAVDGVLYGPIEAKVDRAGDNSWLTMSLTEGKNREIKVVLATLGLQVTRLIRVSFGPFQLGDLPRGEVKEIPTRLLKDQLGPRLAAEAEADFNSPVTASAPQAKPRRMGKPNRPSGGDKGFGSSDRGSQERGGGERFAGDRRSREGSDRGGFAPRPGARSDRPGGKKYGERAGATDRPERWRGRDNDKSRGGSNDRPRRSFGRADDQGQSDRRERGERGERRFEPRGGADRPGRDRGERSFGGGGRMGGHRADREGDAGGGRPRRQADAAGGREPRPLDKGSDRIGRPRPGTKRRFDREGGERAGSGRGGRDFGDRPQRDRTADGGPRSGGDGRRRSDENANGSSDRERARGRFQRPDGEGGDRGQRAKPAFNAKHGRPQRRDGGPGGPNRGSGPRKPGRGGPRHGGPRGGRPAG